MWEWLHDASPGEATFLGSLTGSSIGLVALLLGALFNAHLNRRRDDQLRREEQRTVATALHAELVGWRDRLQSTIALMRSEPEVGRPVLTARLFPDMIPKLGFLPSATIQNVVAAYDQADWYSSRVVRGEQPEGALYGGAYTVLAEETVDIITRAIALLDHSWVSTRTWREMSWPERWRWLRSTG
jgi:hypothetical protein